MRAFCSFTVLAALALVLGACGGGSSGAGVSTASLLDGSSSNTAEVAPISNTDPNARPVQVAWTAARAQKCGFAFDAGKLRANFIATEARGGALQPQLASTEKTYDQTFASISTKLKGEQDYCDAKKTASIKSDLQRHLAGDFTPNLPNPNKKVASGGFWDGLISDAPPEPFDSKNFWNDMAAKKSGASGAQKTE